MDALERYPLSVILSYLTETEGTSLLITKRHYAKWLLPQFRVRKSTKNEGLRVLNAKKQNRHWFRVAPIQDPETLLERLNTRKLYKRKQRQQQQANSRAGCSTSCLAQLEWNSLLSQKQTNDGKEEWNVFSPDLGLLRFLDSSTCGGGANNNKQLTKNGNKNNNAFFTRPNAAGGATLLVSYPRSGNTLLRTLLERVTGIVTGSDTRPDRSLSRELAEQHDLVGEGVISAQRVAFIKTHWPERCGNGVYRGQRAVLLVRNPYDAIDSYWNLNATKSHTQTLTDAMYVKFADKFERLVQNEIHVWIKFHNFWLQQRQGGIPVLLVRFEDLIQDPAGQLERVLKFSLGQQDESTSLDVFWKRRIDYVTQSSSSDNLGSYRPRASTKGAKSIGKSIFNGRYTREMIQSINKTAANEDDYPVNLLKAFGYVIRENGFPLIIPPMQEEMLQNSYDAAPPNDSGTNKSSCSVEVNSGTPVRPVDCEFGRSMQQWRHGVTNKDQNPLPTIVR